MIKLKEFYTYFYIGATTTVIDWSFFWIAIHLLNLHYELSLILAYFCGGLFHYSCNKLITFKCHSLKIGSQYTVYFLLTGTSLLISMGVIAILVNIFLLSGMSSRIVTSALMLIPNYLLHKHITFSRRLFIQPEGN